VWALCTDTEEEARFQFLSRAHVRLLRDTGRFVALEPPSVAAKFPFTAAELARIDQLREDSFVGTGPQVAERIKALAARLNVQEIAVVTWAYDEAVRHKSYRLLAEAMALGA
jgi:alkanesulfonate monooxygenase SsuD/methylene tetrahydromethanopterin reductase-like flavin-dependent oxidoreductase (luciferase family)